jgi:hypothetical protein
MRDTRSEELIDRERAAGVAFGPFHRRWLLDRPGLPESIRRNLVLAQRYPHLVAARQGLSTMDTNDVNTAAFAAINTSLAELNMIGATQAIMNQFCAIPPNDARPGKVYELTMGGTYGNVSATTPTMIFTPRWGTSTTPATNITLGANAAWTSITGTTGLPYLIDFIFTIRTAPPGATLGTGYGLGTVSLGIPLTSSQVVADIVIGGTAATIDTTGQGTAGCGLTMNLTWSASNAANTSTCQYFILRSLN